MPRPDRIKKERALRLRKLYQGMLGTECKVPVRDRLGLSMVYTPGVAEPCRAIRDNPEEAYTYTSKGESMALVSNGSDVVDLGDIGPAAVLPILEGEAAMLSELGGLSVYPLCVTCKRVKEFRFLLGNIAPAFGAIAVFGLNKELYDEMADTFEAGIPLIRYEDVLDRVFARRSGLTPRQKFCDSYMAVPGFFNALIASRACDVSNVVYYAAGREIEDTLKSVSGFSTRVVDFRLAERVARVCADGFNASGAGQVKVDSDALAARIHSIVFENRNATVEMPEAPYDDEHLMQAALEMYRRHRGSIRTRARARIVDRYSLDVVAGRGGLWAAEEIAADPDLVWDYTSKGNTVAVISDGSAVLGMGNIGGTAGLPVMEGKCVLFRTLAGINAHPLVLATRDAAEIEKIISMTSHTYGAVNLEDIGAPKCFELERNLREKIDIPVFHDDQHGTAAVVLAGLINALRLTGRDAGGSTAAVNGAGAAGLTVARALLKYGFKDVVLCDTTGAIYDGREENMNDEKREMAKLTNKAGIKGGIAEAMRGRNVFIGVSSNDCVTKKMVASMAENPIVFALANPVPEIMPEVARAAGAKVIATGRSDFPNQVNNALIFPGLFRGALGVRAGDINDDMKLAAAKALAESIPQTELDADHFIPCALDIRVVLAVAEAVARAALAGGVARTRPDPLEISNATAAFLYEGLDRVKEPPPEAPTAAAAEPDGGAETDEEEKESSEPGEADASPLNKDG